MTGKEAQSGTEDPTVMNNSQIFRLVPIMSCKKPEEYMLKIWVAHSVQ